MTVLFEKPLPVDIHPDDRASIAAACKGWNSAIARLSHRIETADSILESISVAPPPSSLRARSTARGELRLPVPHFFPQRED